MSLTVIRTGVFGVNSLVVPIDNEHCFVVDPAGCSLTCDETKIKDFLDMQKLKCVEIVLTHFHFDHITGIAPLKEAFPDARIAIHDAEYDELQNPPGPLGTALVNSIGSAEILNEIKKQPNADIALYDGANIFGWDVIHTPGHSPGSICLYNQRANSLISGDTLFCYGGYGRTDLPGGNEEDMKKSLNLLRERIPEGTRVFPGHESFDFPFYPDF